jgi:hypothetical protein
LNDPEVQEALAAAQRAHTDRELRESMYKHYTLLFAKMRKIDASLEKLIRERETAALKPLQGKLQTTTSNGNN